MNGGPGNASRLRRLFEVGGWFVLVAVLWGTDLFVKFAEREQAGFGKDSFRLITEQATSAAAVLIMVLFVIRWLHIFPIRRDAWIPAIVGHSFGSFAFAAGHYSLTVMMRMAIYSLNDMTYIWREPFIGNLLLEYQKDIKIYLGIIAVIIAYRRLPQLQSRPATASDTEGRLFVQTGSGKAVLRFEEIEFLEAARNYVVIHARRREYLVRDTMANLQEKLSGAPFIRTHRSFIVNVDRVREIKTVDSKLRIFLDSGRDVPLSRGYEAGFQELVGQG